MPTVILNTSETTFVSSALPDTNFSTNPVIYAGTDEAFQNTISFLRYTLPSLPVSEVDSAILQLSIIIKTGAAPSPVVINRVTSPLDTDTVTYNTQPAFIPTASQIDINTGDLYTTIQIDITELVNQWINGTSPNYGLALTNSDGTTVVGFATNEILHEPFYPVLILTYPETPVSPETYAYINNTDDPSIAAEDSISLNANDALPGISHYVGTGLVTMENAST